MNFKSSLILCCLLIIGMPLYAQKEANIWYFSDGRGLDFNFDPPKVLSNSTFLTYNGSTSLCDQNGKLLFFSDGERLWNANNSVLIDNLSGSNNSQQASIILPHPEKPFHYIIFSSGAYSKKLILTYSVFYYKEGDFQSLEHNTVLMAAGSEALAVTAPCSENPLYYWILTASQDNLGKLYSFKLDSSGVSKKPVISNIDAELAVNYIKFSPNGTHVGYIEREREFEDDRAFLHGGTFDMVTGTFRETDKLSLTQNLFYNQFEFSGNGKYIYASEKGFISQIITDGLERIHTVEFDSAAIGGLQLAPNGKIYINRFYNDLGYLGVINNPNKAGLDNNFNQYGIIFDEPQIGYGLPSFPAHYFFNGFEAVAGQDSTLCSGEEIQLGEEGIPNISYQWFPSQNLSNPNQSNPRFLLDNISNDIAEKEYVLKVTDDYCERLDTVVLQIKPSPGNTIKGVASVCPFVEEVEYSVNQVDGVQYHWEVIGGELVNYNTESKIKVNWGPTSNASVSVSYQTDFVCDYEPVIKPVKIKLELETETPKGPDILCKNDLSNHEYAITNANGSVYTWGTLGGELTSETQTSQVSINWKDPPYKLWVKEKSTTKDTVCYGISDTLNVHIKSDTAFLKLNYVSVLPEDDKNIEINWAVTNGFDIAGPLLLLRREGVKNFQKLSEVAVSDTQYIDSAVLPDSLSYEYQLSALNSCNYEIFSEIHNTILLKHKFENEDEVSLFFNPYINWASNAPNFQLNRIEVEEYFTIDELINPPETRFTINNSPDISHNQYRIIVKGPNNFIAYSNDVAFKFENKIDIPNVITPNKDGFNDQLKIRKIDYYPENEITIVNRYGQRIFYQKNYQQNWPNSEIPAGTYYYYFVTLEPKREFRGWVQVLTGE